MESFIRVVVRIHRVCPREAALLIRDVKALLGVLGPGDVGKRVRVPSKVEEAPGLRRELEDDAVAVFAAEDGAAVQVAFAVDGKVALGFAAVAALTERV